jgi:hypothetical protein
MQINKNERYDAVGIARTMPTGWFKEVASSARTPLVVRDCYSCNRH